jgi:hypothetical protein
MFLIDYHIISANAFANFNALFLMRLVLIRKENKLDKLTPPLYKPENIKQPERMANAPVRNDLFSSTL